MFAVLMYARCPEYPEIVWDGPDGSMAKNGFLHRQPLLRNNYSPSECFSILSKSINFVLKLIPDEMLYAVTTSFIAECFISAIIVVNLAPGIEKENYIFPAIKIRVIYIIFL